MDRWALKRLTETDLTIFRWHFQHQPAWRGEEAGEARQKAINLNSDVLTRLYPAFGPDTPSGGVAVSLRLFGPGKAGADRLTRTIIRQQKNWRLDGEVIANPLDDETRYDSLRQGDLALMHFTGEPYPHAMDIMLISQHADAALHAELSPLVEERRGMAVLQPDVLLGIVGTSRADSLLRQLVQPDAETIATLGEPPPQLAEKQVNRPVFRGFMSPSDLEETRARQSRTGRIGEELVGAYLEGLVGLGVLNGVVWISQDNAIAPYDFVVSRDDGVECRIDVKSTAGTFDVPLHVSVNELRAITEDVPYKIYRVFELDAVEYRAKLRVVEKCQPLAEEILARLVKLPAGIGVASVAVHPTLLEWGEEKEIQIPAD